MNDVELGPSDHLSPELRKLLVLAYEIETALKLRWIRKTRNLCAVFYTKRSKYKSRLKFLGPIEQY